LYPVCHTHTHTHILGIKNNPSSLWKQDKGNNYHKMEEIFFLSV